MNKVVLNFYGHHKCATQWIIGILNNIAIASGYSLFHAMERAHFSLMDLKSIDKSKNVIVILGESTPECLDVQDISKKGFHVFETQEILFRVTFLTSILT